MEGKIAITKTGRYITHGNPVSASHLIIALHGYGQLPAYFIRKFQHLDPEQYFIIAPEGLHRFYLSGSSGRVGASWMTKEARMDDIEDNIAYLNQLTTEIISKNTFKHHTLLGFSQGGATAARWHEHGNLNADNFVLWASVFPPDLELPKNQNAFIKSTNIFIVGDEDEYYKKADIETMSAHLALAQLNFETIIFKGKHTINPSGLSLLFNRI